jgi:hypothetical protein
MCLDKKASLCFFGSSAILEGEVGSTCLQTVGVKLKERGDGGGGVLVRLTATTRGDGQAFRSNVGKTHVMYLVLWYLMCL